MRQDPDPLVLPAALATIEEAIANRLCHPEALVIPAGHVDAVMDAGIAEVMIRNLGIVKKKHEPP